MQSASPRVEIAASHMPMTHSTHPRISPRTFVHCLNALYVNTQVLASNVVSLHLHMAGQDEFLHDAPVLLSRMQLDLVEQGAALRHQISLLRGSPAAEQEWIYYAKLWRISQSSDGLTALVTLREGTDLLMELYESMLPLAAEQRDQAISYYLLAGHLANLNEHWLALGAYCHQMRIMPA